MEIGILLDTNAYTKFVDGDRDIWRKIKNSGTVYFSTIVLGELYTGFMGGTKEAENIARLNKFLHYSKIEILNVSSKTAEIFGKVWGKLKRGGTPLPHNDIWIAAHAIEKDVDLISYDKHFLSVDGLKMWKNL